MELRALTIGERLAHRGAISSTTELWAGHEASPDDPGIDAVGALLAIAADGTVNVHCTATLIAPDVVITAGHCFTSRLCGGESNDARDGAFDFVQGLHAMTASGRNRVVGMTCASADPCDGDLALARLSTPIGFDAGSDLGIADPDDSAPLIKIGYGAYHRAGSPPGSWVPAGTRAEATAEIDPSPQPPPSTFTYRGVNGTRKNVEICGGDSGGPGIQTSGASYHLVGVTSGSVGDSNAPQAADCNPQGTDTRLSVHAGWVSSTLATMPSLSGNQCP